MGKKLDLYTLYHKLPQCYMTVSYQPMRNRMAAITIKIHGSDMTMEQTNVPSRRSEGLLSLSLSAKRQEKDIFVGLKWDRLKSKSESPKSVKLIQNWREQHEEFSKRKWKRWWNREELNRSDAQRQTDESEQKPAETEAHEKSATNVKYKEMGQTENLNNEGISTRNMKPEVKKLKHTE